MCLEGRRRSVDRDAGPRGRGVRDPGQLCASRLHRHACVESWLDEGQKIVEQTRLGRLGAPEEVAAAVAWLGSVEASFVNGARLDVDGELGLHVG